MKKQIKKNHWIGVTPLICIFITIFLSGCNYDKYNAERSYWKANRLYQQLAKKIESAKPHEVLGEQDYQKVIAALQKVTLRYPNWNNTPTAQLLIGRVYVIQDNIDHAVIEFEKVLKDYPTNADACASALLALGRLYEEQNNWDQALEYYNKILNDYIYTYGAYQCSLHLVQYYKTKNQDAIAEAVYRDIFKQYTDFIRENPNTSAAMASEHFIVAFLLEIEKWNEAVAYLGNLIEIHPKTALALRSLYTLGAIYDENLKQPEKAIATYQKIIDDYPDSERVKLAQEKIKVIKSKTKEKK